MDETFRQNRKKNYYILTKINKILVNSVFDRTEMPKHIRLNDSIYKFHILYSKIRLPNKIQTLMLNVAEDTQGKKYYYYKPIETIKIIS